MIELPARVALALLCGPWDSRRVVLLTDNATLRAKVLELSASDKACPTQRRA